MPADQRRVQLIATSLSVFASEGYHDTSMNNIARQAGVTKPVLYQHFESKRDLFVAVLDESGAELYDRVAKATASATSPRGQIVDGFSAYFHFVEEHPNAFSVLFGTITRRDPEFAEIVERIESSIADVVANNIDIESLSHQRRTLLGNAIVGMAENACRYWIQNDVDVDARTLADEVSQLAWAGLRGVK